MTGIFSGIINMEIIQIFGNFLGASRTSRLQINNIIKLISIRGTVVNISNICINVIMISMGIIKNPTFLIWELVLLVTYTNFV